MANKNFGQNRFFWFLVICSNPNWPEMAYNVVKWSNMISMDHNYWFWENWEKFFKNFSKFWGGDGLSNRFLSDSQFFPTFCDFTSIDQVLLFNLSHMALLEVIGLKSYYEITKKLRQNRKFRSKKYFFLDFENMFWDYFLKFFNLHWRFPTS